MNEIPGKFKLNLYIVVLLFFAGIPLYAKIARNWTENLALSVLGIVVVQLITDFKPTVQYCKVFVLTFYRDMWSLHCLIWFQAITIKWIARHKKNPARLLEDTAKSYPFKPALIQAETGKRVSFQEINEYATQVANYFISQGFVKGDVVGLICDNQLEYAGIWIGLNRAGFVPALLNYKLQGDGLKHCLGIVDCKGVIVLSELLHNVLELNLSKVKIYEFSGSSDMPSHRDSSVTPESTKNVIDFNSEVKTQSIYGQFPLPDSIYDTCVYIYTSGTTGHPKAAKISTVRFCLMGFLPFWLYKMRKTDILYCSLPLYHSNGGMVVFNQAVTQGCTVVLRKKFSASKHWDDCIKYKATGFNYIGEICRFLLAKKPSVNDTAHSIRFIIGNGLKPEIWRIFVDRFKIAKVHEFYGATEGVANIANPFSKEGCCGFITRIAPRLYPVCVIKVDLETNEVIRGSDGFCVMTKPDETGMIVGKIEEKGIRKFDGYKDKSQSSSKIVRDVMRKGDSFFLTGDLVTADELGWIRFQDRTGDTFRWKGENCSTAEVEATACRVLNNHDLTLACVSTEIPGNDGKAGLLAIDISTANEEVVVADFCQKMKNALPGYAVPVVLRLTRNIELTGSFKVQKVKVRKLGYDVRKLPADDKLYVLQAGEYKVLSEELYDAMVKKELRF